MAFTFNGTTQYLSSFVPNGIGVNEPITMACWFNVASSTADQTLISVALKGDSTSPFYRLSARGDIAGDPIEAAKYKGSAPTVSARAGTFAVNTWSFAAAVFASDNSRTAHLNTSSATDTTSSVDASVSFDNLAIGALNRTTPVVYLNGQIAEVALWNAELTSAELAALSRGVTCDQIRPQSLVFYAPLVRELRDLKGGLTITNNNGATVSDHPRVYA